MSEMDSHADEVVAKPWGSRGVMDEWYALVYEELHALAMRYFRNEALGHTLQPTALVHEAFVRLNKNKDLCCNGPEHLQALVASTMRHVLVDHARRRMAEKRGGGWQRTTLTGTALFTPDLSVDLLDLDEALNALAELSKRQERVVVLRFFGGMTIAEVAIELGVGTTTVDDEWAYAKAWLGERLSKGAEG